MRRKAARRSVQELRCCLKLTQVQKELILLRPEPNVVAHLLVCGSCLADSNMVGLRRVTACPFADPI